MVGKIEHLSLSPSSLLSLYSRRILAALSLHSRRTLAVLSLQPLSLSVSLPISLSLPPRPKTKKVPLRILQ